MRSLSGVKWNVLNIEENFRKVKCMYQYTGINLVFLFCVQLIEIVHALKKVLAMQETILNFLFGDSDFGLNIKIEH